MADQTEVLYSCASIWRLPPPHAIMWCEMYQECPLYLYHLLNSASTRTLKYSWQICLTIKGSVWLWSLISDSLQGFCLPPSDFVYSKKNKKWPEKVFLEFIVMLVHVDGKALSFVFWAAYVFVINLCQSPCLLTTYLARISLLVHSFIDKKNISHLSGSSWGHRLQCMCNWIQAGCHSQQYFMPVVIWLAYPAATVESRRDDCPDWILMMSPRLDGVPSALIVQSCRLPRWQK